MNSSYDRNELARLATAEATLLKEVAHYESDMGKARAAAAQRRNAPGSTRSPTMAQSHNRAADAESRKVASAADKLATVKQRLARNAAYQATKRRSLEAAEKTERTNAAREEQQRRDKDKAQQRDADRAAERRRRVEKDHAREVGRLSQ